MQKPSKNIDLKIAFWVIVPDALYEVLLDDHLSMLIEAILNSV